MEVHFGSSLKKTLDSGKVYSATIGYADARLTDKVAKAYKMATALRKFGRALARQYNKGGRHVTGIELHTITFSLLLGPKDKNTKQKGGA